MPHYLNSEQIKTPLLGVLHTFIPQKDMNNSAFSNNFSCLEQKVPQKFGFRSFTIVYLQSQEGKGTVNPNLTFIYTAKVFGSHIYHHPQSIGH